MNLKAFVVAPTIIVAALLALAPFPLMASDGESAERERVEGWIKDYLMENPEVIRDAIMELQRRDEAAKDRAIKTAIAANYDLLANDPDSYVAGNPDGDITVVEFFDYKCGYCKRALPTLMDLIKSDKNIRVVFKEFPILGPQSVIASRAAIAALKQGQSGEYLDFHQKLMMAKGELSEGRIMEIASKSGFDPARLAKDMRSQSVEDVIGRNHRLASMLGISGTPAFVIGNQIVPGAISLEEMKQLVAAERASN